jgi:hypothetical protein
MRWGSVLVAPPVEAADRHLAPAGPVHLLSMCMHSCPCGKSLSLLLSQRFACSFVPDSWDFFEFIRGAAFLHIRFWLVVLWVWLLTKVNRLAVWTSRPRWSRERVRRDLSMETRAKSIMILLGGTLELITLIWSVWARCKS